jgi:predicted RecA/RadA family phage recombinase
MKGLLGSIFGAFLLGWAITAVNDVVPVYRPGSDITCKASVALTGKRLCMISGNRTSGAGNAGVGLSATPDGGNYQVGNPTGGGRVFGVVGYDTPSGGLVPVKREGVLPITASGAIAAGAEVEALADGRVITRTTGIPIGVCLNGCANAEDAEIQLYLSGSIA